MKAYVIARPVLAGWKVMSFIAEDTDEQATVAARGMGLDWPGSVDSLFEIQDPKNTIHDGIAPTGALRLVA